MFILDTNVVSELRRPEKADKNLVAWATVTPHDAIFLSVVTLLELGVLRTERKDKKQGLILRNWLETHVVPRFAGSTFPIDAIVARRCAALHVPDPRTERDALIAATALVHGLTVVTRNTRDFESTGVRLFNPWA